MNLTVFDIAALAVIGVFAFRFHKRCFSYQRLFTAVHVSPRQYIICKRN